MSAYLVSIGPIHTDGTKDTPDEMTPSPALKSLSTAEPPNSLRPTTGLLTLHLVNSAGYGPRVSMGISVID